MNGYFGSRAMNFTMYDMEGEESFRMVEVGIQSASFLVLGEKFAGKASDYEIFFLGSKVSLEGEEVEKVWRHIKSLDAMAGAYNKAHWCQGRAR